MKKQTKAQIYSSYAEAVKAIREGKPVKRTKAKDGSIPTHPVIEVLNPLPEKNVLAGCLAWLRGHRIFCNRMNVGGGALSASGYRTYGIKGAGDIVGLTLYGLHFEIECKAGKGGRLSAEQQKRMKNIRENHGLYVVVHDVLELEFYFQDYLDSKFIGGSDL